MASARLPTLFLSHGAPDLILRDHPAREFLSELGQQLPRPEAIVMVSAHWIADPVGITGAARPETLHDFGGFADALYRQHYPALGDSALASRIQKLLNTAGIAAEVDPQRGYDHGAWMPLMLIYPAAQIPTLQVSLPAGDPQALVALGRALRPLRDQGVLIIGSGGSTHNLMAMNLQGETPEWVTDFEVWLDAAVTGGHFERVTEPQRWPESFTLAHPTMEHFAPLPLVWAAADERAAGRRLHQSLDYGALSMSHFLFE